MQATAKSQIIDSAPDEEGLGHDRRPCPLGRASSILGDRWILLIMRDATVGVSRFDEFRAHLGIADNILS
ncbi:MAG: winged helix-turn-helix transcriptional regulator, partial [Actinocrinis sp.]